MFYPPAAHISDKSDRILRGGCFQNWAIHCTVSKRYEIGADYHDGCIGFRLVLEADERTCPDSASGSR